MKEVDDDNVEKPEEAGPKVYDTSEKHRKYEPIRTDSENDALQIHRRAIKRRLQFPNVD